MAFGDGEIATKRTVYGLAAVMLGSVVFATACLTREVPNTDGQNNGDDDDDDGGASSTELPVCAFTTAAGGDTTFAVLTVGRAFLDCDYGVASEDCLSPDTSSCPDNGSSVMGGTLIECSDQCELDQYAVSVTTAPVPLPDGGSEILPAPALAASCEQAAVAASGALIYCCDCDGT